MTIYEELIERVSNGETFYIDFENQTMKIGKQKIIDNGDYDEGRILFGNSELEMSDIISHIEMLYSNYKYSLPSERSDDKRKKYFKALPIEKIPDEQLMTAERREVASCRLEGFILCMVLDGQFTWDECYMGKWFWESKQDPDLIILRKWIEK